MKRIYFTLSCLLIAVCSFACPNNCEKPSCTPDADAQRKEFSVEEYLRQRNQFIEEKCCLTKEEMQKLTPLIDEMYEEQRKIEQEKREIAFTMEKAKTEAEFKKIVEKVTEAEVKCKEVEEKYYRKFAAVITWKKAAHLHRALSQFKFKMLREFTPNGNKNKRGHERRKK